MIDHSLNTSKTSLSNSNCKDKHFTQMQQVFEAFKRKPSTMLMISIETGVLRANICRYVAHWKRTGTIHLLNKRLCKVTNCKAGYYTTNTDLFPQTLRLF